MSKVMILGAGISQVPLIRKAKQLGHHTIVLSWRGNYPGISMADRYYDVSTTDVAAIESIAKAEQIDGICTTGSDAAVQAIGKLNDSLNLSGISYEASLLATNKWLMKEAFILSGVRTAACSKVTSEQEALEAAQQLMPLGSAVIFKAIDSGASRGIVKVTHLAQVTSAYETVMSVTKQRYFIVEQFIDGFEFGAQAFIYGGQIQFILAHGDLMYYGDTGVPIGHHVPYTIADSIRDDMIRQLTKSIKALQLNNCAVNADFICNNDQVYVLEVGARAGATCLPELVSTYYHIDYYEQMLRVALGQTPQVDRVAMEMIHGTACVCELMISKKGGYIKSQENKNRPHSNVVSLVFDYEVGHRVPKFCHGTDRIGQIVVKGNTLKEAQTFMEEVKKNIVIRIE